MWVLLQKETLPVLNKRARYAVANLALAAPDLDMLDDLAQLTEWLELFHVNSMVELDYGAVADKVYPDDSPMDISAVSRTPSAVR